MTNLWEEVAPVLARMQALEGAKAEALLALGQRNYGYAHDCAKKVGAEAALLAAETAALLAAEDAKE